MMSQLDPPRVQTMRFRFYGYLSVTLEYKIIWLNHFAVLLLNKQPASGWIHLWSAQLSWKRCRGCMHIIRQGTAAGSYLTKQRKKTNQ